MLKLNTVAAAKVVNAVSVLTTADRAIAFLNAMLPPCVEDTVKVEILSVV